jgi:hypothetical protein
MTGRSVERIESAVDAGAALLLAAAVSYALWTIVAAQSVAAAGGVGAFAACLAGLRRIPSAAPCDEDAPRCVTPVADLLAEADRSLAHAEDELVLEDILAALGPDSRVVRLFEPGNMPTPAQMKARIDRHLEGDGTAAPDASQALHDALADLRRSLN